MSCPQFVFEPNPKKRVDVGVALNQKGENVALERYMYVRVDVDMFSSLCSKRENALRQRGICM